MKQYLIQNLTDPAWINVTHIPSIMLCNYKFDYSHVIYNLHQLLDAVAKKPNLDVEYSTYRPSNSICWFSNTKLHIYADQFTVDIGRGSK